MSRLDIADLGSVERTMRAGATVEKRSISEKKKDIDDADIHVQGFVR